MRMQRTNWRYHCFVGGVLGTASQVNGLRMKQMSQLVRSIQDGEHENKVLLLLTLIIGAVVGLVVVAFILLTENLGGRLYPANGAAWRRLVMPVAGALVPGFLLSPFFSN